ncbi:MAG: sulfatase-like hydrolase/transferase [Mangrovibacterium sp.]
MYSKLQVVPNKIFSLKMNILNMRRILVFYLAGAFVIISCNSGTQNRIQKKKPNILFLFADDQRFNTIAALGNNEIITPNLDKLVENGTTFTNAYIMGAMNGAVCAPSRAMLMTSRSVFKINPADAGLLHLPDTLLPKALSNNGYTTFHTGKWHNGKRAFKVAFDDGSRIFFGGMHDQYAVPTYEFNGNGEYPDSMETVRDIHSSELYADAAINFIKELDEDDPPFFMYVAFQAPHDPREMPQKFLDMYDADNISLPANFMPEHPFDNGELDIRDEWLAGYPRTKAEIKANIRAYYAMITHLDEQIGRIIHELDQKGLRENTVIIFSADNGLAVGQHGLMGKQNLYEHSIKVPLIFQGPEIPENVRKEGLSYLIDVYPTLCDLTNTKIPQSVEGKSLLPVIKGEEDSVRESMIFAYKNNQRAIRKGDYKLIKYMVDDQRTNQLFNLKDDPWEINNLYDSKKHSTLITELEEELQERLNESGDNVKFSESYWGVEVLPRWVEKVDRKTQDRLRSSAEKERKMRGF